ncbi:hypothetical protein RchiOBHm_Chr5g0029251 [Rosa chinensis]|uniref:Uncharacterized protein n=1 Tax=Rosa chinensis TaxID=74649 RepID=A0A2P6PUX6_ROSCH|nr:hypothetical protein RchiOBHm_Chr6g0286871 [Rosa chinensis]PRQ30865.1 hypothetical protein RchiOBHm_Chr5g0029251 [Rosa chinensis]
MTVALVSPLTSTGSTLQSQSQHLSLLSSNLSLSLSPSIGENSEGNGLHLIF